MDLNKNHPSYLFRNAHPIKTDSISGIIRRLLDEYRKNKTFGNQSVLLLEGDPLFTLKDWSLMFQTVPRLRLPLIAGLMLKYFFFIAKPNRRPPAYASIKIEGAKKYHFSHRSVYGECLILEACVRTYESAKNPNELEHELKKIVENFTVHISKEGRVINDSTNKIYKFGYYPQIDHQIPGNNPMYRPFKSWDMAVPDNDSTLVLYDSLQLFHNKLSIKCERHTKHLRDMNIYLDHFKSHLKSRGKYGQKKLSFDNGMDKSDVALLTWTMDDHNEIDPSVNINFLSYLATVFNLHDNRNEITELSNIVLRFLHCVVTRNQFLVPRTHLYFPLASVCFLWYRYLLHFDGLIEEERSVFDHLNYTAGINDYLINKLPPMIEKRLFNPHDLALMYPLLIKNGALSQGDFQNKMDPYFKNSFFKDNNFHFTHIRYPSKLICSIDSIPFAAYLYCQMEFRKQPKNHFSAS